MGAWGMGVFDDDTSCGIIDDVIESDRSIESLIEVALAAAEADYIEYTECHEIIVASAMVDALINNTCYEDIDELSVWLSNQDKIKITPLKPQLVTALQKVLGDVSELNELWSENEEDYPVWKANIEKLIRGISN